MAGAEWTAKRFREGAHTHACGIARRVHLRSVGREHQIDAHARALSKVTFEVARVATEVLGWGELRRVHEDREGRVWRPALGFARELQMAGMQRSHGRYEPHPLTLRPCATERLAERFASSCDLGHRHRAILSEPLQKVVSFRLSRLEEALYRSHPMRVLIILAFGAAALVAASCGARTPFDPAEIAGARGNTAQTTTTAGPRPTRGTTFSARKGGTAATRPASRSTSCS